MHFSRIADFGGRMCAAIASAVGFRRMRDAEELVRGGGVEAGGRREEDHQPHRDEAAREHL